MEPFNETVRRVEGLLGAGRNFDLVRRELVIAGRRALLYLVNGYAKDELLERLIDRWLALPELPAAAEDFVQTCVSAADAKAEGDWQKAAVAVFSGKSLLLVEGYEKGVLAEAKTYPTRSVQEPDTSRVLRGSHDGFTENIMENAALLRRRVRDPHLTLENVTVGGRTKADVAVIYMSDEADRDLLSDLRKKLSAIDVNSLSMSQESLAECIAPPQWWNPFPKVRYTERPDVAVASIMEGSILVMVDNSPCVMILPTTIFSFTEEVNDYYFPPLIGSYLKIVRLTVLFLTLFITPLWYLLVKNPDTLPGGLQFLLVQEEYYVPLILQLLLVEFIIDILKLASLNTPDALSNSFSMLGALILGDFAVQARWLVPEVLVYMAFVAVVNYAQHSYEMGYATKLCRMGLLLCIWAGNWWGFGIGVAAILALMASTRPILGRSYLYPLIPPDRKAMWRMLHRRHIDKHNT